MHRLLSNALALSAQINQLAVDEKWSEIADLAASRQSNLEAYFELSPLPDPSHVVLKTAQEIRKNDQFVCEIIDKHKQHSINKSLDLKSSLHAINQYRNTSNRNG